MICIKDLSLAFARDGQRTVVLEKFDLSVRRGEFLAIVGASGVGKSTLLRVLAGLARPDSGSVNIHAHDPSRRAVALVFQDARLLPWRRVISNVAFGLEHGAKKWTPVFRTSHALDLWNRSRSRTSIGPIEVRRDLARLRLPRGERLRRAQAMLDLVGLHALAQRWPHQLSGGQRQRVSLARALAVEPDILLMDEPFSALDAITREGLQDEIIRIWRTTGKTILFVTHDIDEATYLADRVVVLAGSPGRIVAEHRIDAPRPRQRKDATLIAVSDRLRAGLATETIMDGAAI